MAMTIDELVDQLQAAINSYRGDPSILTEEEIRADERKKIALRVSQLSVIRWGDEETQGDHLRQANDLIVSIADDIARNFDYTNHPEPKEDEMEVEFDETEETIEQWALETFGPRTLARSAERTVEEMQEMIDHYKAGDLYKMISEVPDVVIMFCSLIPAWNKEMNDDRTIYGMINRKMMINRRRIWKLHGDGTGQHID